MCRRVIMLVVSCVMILCSSCSKSIMTTIDNIQYEDIPNVTTDMTTRINDAREIANQNSNNKTEDLLSCVDNDTPLSILLQDQKKVDSDITWLFATSLFDSDRFNRNPIEWAEALIHDEIVWFREVAIESDSNGITFHRLYSVRESELGGYIYLYFNHYPSDGHTIFKATVYVPHAIEKKDLEHIQEGASIEDVIAIDRSAMSAKKNKLNGFDEQGISGSFHLLKDGFAYIEYTNDIVTGILFCEDYTISNLLRYCGGTTDEEQIEAKNLPENRYNYSILTQDYPQS